MHADENPGRRISQNRRDRIRRYAVRFHLDRNGRPPAGLPGYLGVDLRRGDVKQRCRDSVDKDLGTLQRCRERKYRCNLGPTRKSGTKNGYDGTRSHGRRRLRETGAIYDAAIKDGRARRRGVQTDPIREEQGPIVIPASPPGPAAAWPTRSGYYRAFPREPTVG